MIMNNNLDNTGDGAASAELLRRLEASEAQLRTLREQLGVADADEAVRLVRSLEARVTGPVRLAPVAQIPTSDEEKAVAATTDPRVAVNRLRDFSTKIATLNGTVMSMEGQLRTLYMDRERLEREIGASEVDDVIAVFQLLKSTIESMGEQLAALYEGKEQLDSQLGRSDPDEIVGMFKSVANLVNNARQELGTVPAGVS